MSNLHLTTDELNWVTDRMGVYKIPYQEVFDEVLDHVLSAIEQARADGNIKPIDVLFQNIVDNQFNGYVGIDKIVEPQEKAYRHKVHRIFWQNYRAILDWKAIVFIAIVVLLVHFIPAKIIATRAIIVATFLLSLIPLIYIYKATRIIKVGKGRKSLIRKHLMANGYLPLLFLNGLLNIPNCIDDINDNHTLHHFMLNHPEVVAFVMALSIIYAVSSVYVCKQELEPYQFST